MIDNQKDKFVSSLKRYSFGINPQALSKFDEYSRLIAEANSALNLLSARDLRILWERHFLDSVCPLLFGIIDKKCSVLDIGSGAGLPGIPLAILSSSINVSMVESNAKKARFIERVIKKLDLKNADIENIRIEDFPKKRLFDFCLARAVSKIKSLLPVMVPHIKSGGSAIFYKGINSETEAECARELCKSLGFSEPKIVMYPENITETRFSLVVFVKE